MDILQTTQHAVLGQTRRAARLSSIIPKEVARGPEREGTRKRTALLIILMPDMVKPRPKSEPKKSISFVIALHGPPVTSCCALNWSTRVCLYGTLLGTVLDPRAFFAVEGRTSKDCNLVEGI